MTASVISPRLERCRDLSQIAANIVVVAGIFLGFAIFWIQRIDQKTAQRREAAMEFVKLKHEDVYRDTAAAISDAFAYEGPNEILQSNQESDKAIRRAEITEAIGLAKIKTMADLYLSVISCVNSKICDEKIASDAYRDDIWAFYCLNREDGLATIGKRLNRKDYAVPMAKFGGACVSEPSPAAAS